MEIERKWMVAGWPGSDLSQSLPLLYTEYQEQGYIHTDAPIVRIRLEARIRNDFADQIVQAEKSHGISHGINDAPLLLSDAARALVQDRNSSFILCFKSAGLLARDEIELPISEEDFKRLARLASHALIRKIRRVYQLPDGLKLEVNLVDEGLASEFMYAEVEYTDEAQALSWDPASVGLGSYLSDDVTHKSGQSMSAFWARTRGTQTV